MNTEKSKIQVTFEPTPNPSTYKFLFHQELVSESAEFSTPQEAERSPLASKIFGFPWTAKVFLGKDFISVTKQDWVEWDILAAPLTGLIQEHIDSEEKLIYDFDPSATNQTTELDPTAQKIKQIIVSEIQPV
ncbi:MAG: NifU N-terminal domain-containing protein, partial [Bdellovibrionales bacterium]|nr:NifU N-terminal domain-containing protein [Bdellovibrionales bacterium]